METDKGLTTWGGLDTWTTEPDKISSWIAFKTKSACVSAEWLLSKNAFWGNVIKGMAYPLSITWRMKSFAPYAFAQKLKWALSLPLTDRILLGEFSNSKHTSKTGPSSKIPSRVSFTALLSAMELLLPRRTAVFTWQTLDLFVGWRIGWGHLLSNGRSCRRRSRCHNGL